MWGTTLNPLKRKHHCEKCNIDWDEPVTFNKQTSNLSGEPTPFCPKCCSRASLSYPSVEYTDGELNGTVVREIIRIKRIDLWIRELRDKRIKIGIDYSYVSNLNKVKLFCNPVYLDLIIEIAEKYGIEVEFYCSW